MEMGKFAYELMMVYCFLKVMCFLEHLQVEFTMLVSLKGGLENTGGMGVPLFLLSQHCAYSLHWHVLSALVSGLVWLCYLLLNFI